MAKQLRPLPDPRQDFQHQIPERPVLTVCCVDTLPEEFCEAVQPYEFSGNSLDGRLRMEKTKYACVIAIIDPTSKCSMKSLEALQESARRCATPLVSCSPFNPSWIENLMQHLGVFAHFKIPPTTQQIIEVSELWERRKSPPNLEPDG